MSSLPAAPTADLQRARRNAAVGAASVGLAVALVALLGSAFLIVLSGLVILIGIVLCLTVVGIVLGVPLIAVGVLGLLGGLIGGSGGVLFALLLGAGSGLLYYENRIRKLRR